MDAQQRLLLESAQEALSQGVSATGSATRTAVMVGITSPDYEAMSTHLSVGIYAASGGTHILVAFPVEHILYCRIIVHIVV